mmetsp:Transcript_34202/g.67633  ORF Transcript_34202/g.67633 Transcript_34202/m.67633 type:complete len:90 (-) Transcript_34202:367-636(-)
MDPQCAVACRSLIGEEGWKRETIDEENSACMKEAGGQKRNEERKILTKATTTATKEGRNDFFLRLPLAMLNEREGGNGPARPSTKKSLL